MEAATPLHKPQVQTRGERLLIESLIVEDEAAVRLAREREQAGEDPAGTVRDAIEIGARVLDREQTGANAEFVKTEFGKASREVEENFAKRAEQVAEDFDAKVDEVFSPESGHLSKALERLFSDGSSHAVQKRVKEEVAEVMTRAREELLRQFSSGDGKNPLADFKNSAVETIREAGKRQEESLHRVGERMAALERELQRLHDEQEKLEEVEAERERGTAKGRSYEELVAEAVEEIALEQNDDAEAVGDQKGPTGKRGDVVTDIDACKGPARGRIVFEAKNSQLTRPKAISELDDAIEQRSADYAVLVVPDEGKVPAKLETLREWGGDKLVVAYDPEQDPRLALEVAYKLARARVLLARSDGEGVDSTAVRDVVERALLTMRDVGKIKQQLTGATTNIEAGREQLETMAARVRDQLSEIEALVRGEGESGQLGL